MSAKKKHKLGHTSRLCVSGMQSSFLAVIGLVQMGIRDPSVIERAMNCRGDSKTRRGVSEALLLLECYDRGGLPRGVYGELRNHVVCPSCSKQITKVPCVSCVTTKRRWPSTAQDTTLVQIGE